MTQGNRRKTRKGRIIRRSGDKTIIVEVQRVVQDPEMKKYVRRTTNYHVHDPKNDGRVGDAVVIQESRPISRTKHWALAKVVQRGAGDDALVGVAV